MNEYQKQANEFLKKTNSNIKIEFVKYDYYFERDTEKRDIYKITLSRENRSFTFNFGQSLNNSGIKLKMGTGKEINFTEKLNQRDKKLIRDSKPINSYCITDYIGFSPCSKDKLIYPKYPDNYSILACLTTFDPGNFDNFCCDYGYDNYSRTAEKIYNAVKNEYQNLCMLYNDDELKLLSKIQ